MHRSLINDIYKANQCFVSVFFLLHYRVDKTRVQARFIRPASVEWHRRTRKLITRYSGRVGLEINKTDASNRSDLKTRDLWRTSSQVSVSRWWLSFSVWRRDLTIGFVDSWCNSSKQAKSTLVLKSVGLVTQRRHFMPGERPGLTVSEPSSFKVRRYFKYNSGS